MEMPKRSALSRYRQRGFTLLELVVVVSIICLLVVLAIDKIWALRAEAERAAVAQVVGALRSALGIETARRFVREGLHSVSELEGSNPMDLLVQRPGSYLGEMKAPDPAGLAGGDWYFDPVDGTLGYKVRFDGSFESTAGAKDWLRYRVILRYRDVNASGRFEQGVDEISGLDLVRIAHQADPVHAKKSTRTKR